MYQLIEEASQVLRTPPPVFDFENPAEPPEEIAKNMTEAMEKFGGLGLSANQVGLPYRMFVMRTMHEGDTESKVVNATNDLISIRDDMKTQIDEFDKWADEESQKDFVDSEAGVYGIDTVSYTHLRAHET
mgnify:CR=1 FL=1